MEILNNSPIPFNLPNDETNEHRTIPWHTTKDNGRCFRETVNK